MEANLGSQTRDSLLLQYGQYPYYWVVSARDLSRWSRGILHGRNWEGISPTAPIFPVRLVVDYFFCVDLRRSFLQIHLWRLPPVEAGVKMLLYSIGSVAIVC